LLDQKGIFNDTKSQLRLIASQAAAGARPAISSRLHSHLSAIEKDLTLAEVRHDLANNSDF
jgi:hypothetical protein